MQTFNVQSRLSAQTSCMPEQAQQQTFLDRQRENYDFSFAASQS